MRAYIFLFIGILILSACGGEDTNNNSGGGSSRSLDITVPPLTPRSIVEGCPSQELVDWFEKTYFNMQTFVSEAEVRSRTAEDGRRSDMDFVLDQLVSLRNAVNGAATPTCVDETHQAIVDDMQIIINHFQLFANAEISADDLESRITRDIQGLKLAIDTLVSEVNPLYAEVTPSP